MKRILLYRPLTDRQNPGEKQILLRPNPEKIVYPLIFWNKRYKYWLILSTVTITFLYIKEEWIWLGLTCPVWVLSLYITVDVYRRYARKISFMFDAIENDDLAFKFPHRDKKTHDQLIHNSLNRINRILFQAKAEAVQKEKYYELILNSIGTGVVVIDDNGYIYQTNREALRLLGLSVFTHIRQLKRVDSKLERLFDQIKAGDKEQIHFSNERRTISLSIRVSEITLQDKHVKIIALSDINQELDAKELESWTRLIRVLTHEIMNSITPITSLSDTLLSLHGETNHEIRNGLEVIRATGKSLISFVESYRKFTHIPTPDPALFYAGEFLNRMICLITDKEKYPYLSIRLDIQPEDLIIYADENLITQVILNLLKNAVQAIGTDRKGGKIQINAYCNEEENILIEISDNGPGIPEEEVEHIFIPFFTTKKEGSGVGLSISRQIMRLSGGSLTLKNPATTPETTFVLTFP